MMRKIITIAFLTQIFTVACNPEDDMNNPVNYMNSLEISADQYPAVSPDGSMVAYYHKNIDYQETNEYPTGLYVMDTNGNNRKLLLKGDHWNPSWAPDGNRIVFTSRGTLQIYNLKKDSIRTFQGVNDVPLFHPDWSWDGRWIVFSSPLENGGFFVSTPNFQITSQLFDISKLHGTDPNWAPACNKILYSKYYKGNEELFVIDTSGANDTRLTNNDRTDRYSRWSPDGSLIAWSSSIRIYVMNSDGSNSQKLDYGRFPCWLPNSKAIIYSNANQDFTKEVLYKIDIDGSNKIQLTY